MTLAALVSACSGGDSTSPGVVTSILLIAPAGTIVVGDSVRITASPRDQKGNTIGAAVSWSSSNSGVATVNGSGVVKGLAVGTASVTAASGSVTATPIVINVIAAGGTFPLSATVYMPGNIYSPFVTDIARTGSVQFVFPPDPHNVIFARGRPGAPPDIDILSNTTRTRQFDTVGTFSYDCTVHPGMTGIIVVH
ncbi:MAG TPA: Ig-like domain-containing protein [Gemmatimonadaceae bacterium]|nr:Ig-like domain-containing protein [Gemmatimonadaceae bacterium]